MKEMCGVTSQEATINDIQRYFKCKDIAKADCNDKGLQFPSKCTTPPCDECGIWNKGITFQSINSCHIFLISKLQQILQYIISFFALEYIFGEKNENCPIGRIVPTEEECKKASSLLGIEYKNKLKKGDYPVGCYTTSDHSSYLNTKLDPSASTPAYYWPNGLGICRTGTMLNLVDPFSDFII